ncbi:MAG: hypothetical protein D6812_05020 [Deltaproteobacteria bacterium]|nr:MAG: hypothetical protein D6812_05020 [Deltaproteobacteria bacterium]
MAIPFRSQIGFLHRWGRDRYRFESCLGRRAKDDFPSVLDRIRRLLERICTTPAPRLNGLSIRT